MVRRPKSHQVPSQRLPPPADGDDMAQGGQNPQLDRLNRTWGLRELLVDRAGPRVGRLRHQRQGQLGDPQIPRLAKNHKPRLRQPLLLP